MLNDNIYIFECAFLQNHIFELLGVYEKSDEEIYLYLKSLLETVKSLSPSIVYIEPSSVEDIIKQQMRASHQRVQGQIGLMKLQIGLVI